MTPSLSLSSSSTTTEAAAAAAATEGFRGDGATAAAAERQQHLTEKHALIVVDMSVEQVGDVSYRRDEVIDNIRSLILAGSSNDNDSSGSGGAETNNNPLFDIMVDSRLWLESPSESSLSWVWQGTGRTLFKAGSEGASLIPELRDDATAAGAATMSTRMTFVRKYNYSCFAGEHCQLLSILRSRRITDVCLCGINTDYCVFATALDAFQNDFRVTVASDAVTSVRGRHAHQEGLRNLERHFGNRVLRTTSQVLDYLGGRKAAT